MTDQQSHPANNKEEVEKNTTTVTTTRYLQQEPKAPYFYYRDFSDLPDPDPSKQVTATGRIPNFPAKMMEILSQPDLAHIVSWMPHGRSWKVHKPREFECKVVPTYFEHSKFSSFIRQANGWGFRRMISKGPDRNSYYHEFFLKGHRHLIKLMKRPTSTTRPQADANTEPDFYQIAKERPLPEPKVGDADGFQREETYYQSYTPENVIPDDDLTPLPFTSSVPPQQRNDPPPIVEVEPYVYYQHQATYYAQQHEAESAKPQLQRTAPMMAPTVSPVLSSCPNTGEPPVWLKLSSPAIDKAVYHIPVSSFVIPINAWTDTCLEPKEMPHDFEDPFAGGLAPVDFW